MAAAAMAARRRIVRAGTGGIGGSRIWIGGLPGSTGPRVQSPRAIGSPPRNGEYSLPSGERSGEEILHEPRPRRAADLRRRSLLRHPAAIEHHHVVGEA